MPYTFDGATIRKEDRLRLGTQMEKVSSLMADGKWRTLEEISLEVGAPQASVSARLRDLRKKRFGLYDVERRKTGEPTGGLHEYRVIPLDDRQLELV